MIFRRQIGLWPIFSLIAAWPKPLESPLDDANFSVHIGAIIWPWMDNPSPSILSGFADVEL